MNVSYEGKVKIELMHGNRVYKTFNVKNTGKLPLFQFITRCLAGYFDVSNAPKYLRIFHVDDINNLSPSTMFNVEVTTVALAVSDTTLSTTGNEASVNFEFIIPPNIFYII